MGKPGGSCAGLLIFIAAVESRVGKPITGMATGFFNTSATRCKLIFHIYLLDPEHNQSHIATLYTSSGLLTPLPPLFNTCV